MNAAVLALAPPVQLVGFTCMSLRTSALAEQLHPFQFRQLLRSVLLGFVGNNVLPLRTGELLRVGYLAHLGSIPSESVLAVVALERVLDVVCLLLLLLGTLPLMLVELPIGATLYALSGGMAVGFVGLVLAGRFPHLVLAWSRWLLTPLGERVANTIELRLRRLLEGLQALRSSRRTAAAIAATMGYWAATILGVQVWLWAFGLVLPWYAPLVVVVFLALGTALPSAPDFVGTYHFFCVAALALFAVPDATALSVGIVGHATAVLPFTLLGIPIVPRDLGGLRRRRAPGDAAPPAPRPSDGA